MNYKPGDLVVIKKPPNWGGSWKERFGIGLVVRQYSLKKYSTIVMFFRDYERRLDRLVYELGSKSIFKKLTRFKKLHKAIKQWMKLALVMEGNKELRDKWESILVKLNNE
jgi:hypothetical protein